MTTSTCSVKIRPNVRTSYKMVQKVVVNLSRSRDSDLISVVVESGDFVVDVESGDFVDVESGDFVVYQRPGREAVLGDHFVGANHVVNHCISAAVATLSEPRFQLALLLLLVMARNMSFKIGVSRTRELACNKSKKFNSTLL